jgi:HD-like signal output (HDOD) protein
MRINNDVMQRLDAVEFPALPSLVLRLAQQLGRERTTAQEIAESVELDATMAARVLRLAISVMLGGVGEVESVAEAVEFLENLPRNSTGKSLKILSDKT